MTSRLIKNITILKGYFLIYLASCIIFTIAKWEILSQEEGWGVVYLVGLIAVGVLGLLVDFILTLFIKNKKLLDIIGIILILIFSIILWMELK